MCFEHVLRMGLLLDGNILVHQATREIGNLTFSRHLLTSTKALNLIISKNWFSLHVRMALYFTIYYYHLGAALKFSPLMMISILGLTVRLVARSCCAFLHSVFFLKRSSSMNLFFLHALAQSNTHCSGSHGCNHFSIWAYNSTI